MTNRIFITKLFLVCAFILGIHLAVIPWIDGTTLVYFHKFSSPPQTSLILGTSRASQAVLPSILRDSLNKEVFNYAFNGTMSPFGDVYNRAIQQKLEEGTETGTFIICADPWAISLGVDSVTGKESIIEERSSLKSMKTFNGYPNLEYVYREYNQGWGSIAYNRWRNTSTTYGHEDGWIEVNRAVDLEEIEKRTKVKAKGFQNSIPKSHFSEYRYTKLKELIQLLEPHGNVYIVRLPVSEVFYQIENQYMPEFDSLMTDLTKQYNVPYFQMQSHSDNMIFNDGHHINHSKGPLCTSLIAQWIKKQELNRQD